MVEELDVVVYCKRCKVTDALPDDDNDDDGDSGGDGGGGSGGGDGGDDGDDDSTCRTALSW